MKSEPKPVVLEAKTMPYLQHLHSTSGSNLVSAPQNSGSFVENNNLEPSKIDDDSKDPLQNTANTLMNNSSNPVESSIEHPENSPTCQTPNSAAAALLSGSPEEHQQTPPHLSFFPERNY